MNSSPPPAYRDSVGDRPSSPRSVTSKKKCCYCRVLDAESQVYSCVACRVHLCVACYCTHVHEDRCVPLADLGFKGGSGHNDLAIEDNADGLDLEYNKGEGFNYMGMYVDLGQPSEKELMQTATFQVDTLRRAISVLHKQEQDFAKMRRESEETIHQRFNEALARAVTEREHALRELSLNMNKTSECLKMEKEVAAKFYASLTSALMGGQRRRPAFNEVLELQAAMVPESVLDHFKQLVKQMKHVLDKTEEETSEPEEDTTFEKFPCFEEVTVPSQMLQQELEALKTENASLLVDKEKLQEDLERLYTAQEDQEKDDDTILYVAMPPNNTEEQDKMREQLATMTARVEDLASQLEGLKAAQQKMATEMKPKSMPHVAFHAFLDKTFRTKSSRVLVCSDVVTNVSNAYDKRTGVFKAPVAGVYQFLAHTGPEALNKTAKIAMYVDDDDVAYMECSDFDARFCHAIVNLKVGQEVFLQTESSKTDMVFSDNCTAFSGVLIHPKV